MAIKLSLGRNARTAIISAAVATVTAAVMAGGPALAKISSLSRAPASPVIVSGSRNGPVSVDSQTQQTIATMHLPTGSWAIFAKGWAEVGSGSV
jgi:hypothetical protein